MKKNIKKYSELAVTSTVEQLFHSIPFSFAKKDVFENIKRYIAKSDKITQYHFVNTFNKIINETNRYFLQLPMWIRDYYKHLFERKLKQIFTNNLFKHIEDEKVLSTAKGLYNLYVKENVLKNWTEYREKHFYMNRNYPYDVK